MIYQPHDLNIIIIEITVCAKCGEPFGKTAKYVTCVCCINIFHANHEKGPNCAEINAAEDKIINIKKNVLLYTDVQTAQTLAI